MLHITDGQIRGWQQSSTTYAERNIVQMIPFGGGSGCIFCSEIKRIAITVGYWYVKTPCGLLVYIEATYNAGQYVNLGVVYLYNMQ